MRKRVERNKEHKKVRRNTKRQGYRRRQNGTSIYFLLWTAFSAFALVIVLIFSIAQSVVLTQTYENEAARDVSDKGKRISAQLFEYGFLPERDFSAYLRFLSSSYDVEIMILSGGGELLFPSLPETEETGKYSAQVSRLKSELQASKEHYAVFHGEHEYVYGSKIKFLDEERYLRVSKSLALMETTEKKIGVRTVFVSLFVFVLAFAVASAVSGWFTRPLSEMTKKTRRLAKGDFEVDFHGTNYGEEMIELADTLNFASQELSKADRMQKELIANISHDFKTPLTMIKAYASMIMEISGDIPEKRNKHAQVIVDEADRLASLVGDILDISKIRSGLASLQTEKTDISALVYEILDRFDYLEETQGYHFVVEIEENLIAEVDRLKISQALYNLLGNAVNYTGDDKTVFVALKMQDNGVFRFSVRDTGKGIKREELSTIWDRYYRSSETHKRPVKGTGLGLSIVKAVFERHALFYGVESEENTGSTFFVDFVKLSEENA